MRFLVLLLAIVISALAQTGVIPGVAGGPPDPLARLREYLGLTDVQSTAILRNNAEYNTFVVEKQRRTLQVQQEIVQQTAAEPLDPMALGIRYAEIEAICRQLRDKANEIYRRNTALFTDAQKSKMSALNEALKLLAIYSEAQASGLTGPYTTAPASLNSFTSYTGIGLTTGVISGGPFYSCQTFNGLLPVVTQRTGDFTFSPSQP